MDLIFLSAPCAYVRLIVLNRPEARNAISTPLLREIAITLAGWAGDEDVRAVVFTGGRDIFAAGADIKEMAAHDAVSIRSDERPALWRGILDFPKPLIAAVNGYALGAGCELAMAADIIVAGTGARFGLPEINLGIIPGAGGTQRLPRVVGKALAMKMVLTGEPIDAPVALAAGLVAEITQPELVVERAVALAEQIASRPPLAAMRAKQAVLQSFETPLEEGLLREREAFASLFSTEDRREGIAAFFEKRKGVFKGR